jgi:hypothetical protein
MTSRSPDATALFPLLIAALLAVRTGRAPTPRHLMQLGAALALCIIANAEYGFFATFFAPALALGYAFAARTSEPLAGPRARKRHVAGAMAVFGLLLLFAFPATLLHPLLHALHLGGAPNPAPLHGDPGERHALHNAWALLVPGVSWLRHIVPTALCADAGVADGEFVHRVGLILPLTVAVGFAIVSYAHLRGRDQSTARACADVRAWLCAGALMVPFGLSSDHFLSLADITQFITDAIAVPTRALVCFDVALVVALGLLLDRLTAVMTRHGFRRPVAAAVTTAIQLLCWVDMAKVSLGAPLEARVLPPPPASIAALAQLPAGAVLTLPFQGPLAGTQDESDALLWQLTHGKPMLNGIHRVGFEPHAAAIAELTNRPDDDTVPVLRHLGVRYVVVPPDAPEFWRQNPALTLRVADPVAPIYEVAGVAAGAAPHASACLRDPTVFCGGLLPTQEPDSHAAPARSTRAAIAREVEYRERPTTWRFITTGPPVRLPAGTYAAHYTFTVLGGKGDDGGNLVGMDVVASGHIVAARFGKPWQFNRRPSVTYDLPFTLTSEAVVELRAGTWATGLFSVETVSYTRLGDAL